MCVVVFGYEPRRCYSLEASRGRGAGRLAGAEPGAERDSRVMQAYLNPRCGRGCGTEHAPRDPFRVLERRHGLAEIAERGAGVLVERPRVNFPHRERDLMSLSQNASRNGYHFAQQRLSFCVAL